MKQTWTYEDNELVENLRQSLIDKENYFKQENSMVVDELKVMIKLYHPDIECLNILKDGTIQVYYLINLKMKEGFHLFDLLEADIFFNNLDNIYKLGKLMETCYNRFLNQRNPLYKIALETMKELYLEPCGIEFKKLNTY